MGVGLPSRQSNESWKGEVATRNQALTLGRSLAASLLTFPTSLFRWALFGSKKAQNKH